jgi:hypothetical protein
MVAALPCGKSRPSLRAGPMRRAVKHKPEGLGEEGGSLEETSVRESEYGTEHAHVEPHCPFCAIRQRRASQHRGRCVVFFCRECNCGYERR